MKAEGSSMPGSLIEKILAYKINGNDSHACIWDNAVEECAETVRQYEAQQSFSNMCAYEVNERLIEKVARAICEADDVNPDGKGYAISEKTIQRLGTEGYPLWRFRELQAKAAIGVITESSKGRTADFDSANGGSSPSSVTNDTLSGYTKEQSAVFDWAAEHGFTPVTSEINDLLNTLKPSEISFDDKQVKEAIAKGIEAGGHLSFHNARVLKIFEAIEPYLKREYRWLPIETAPKQETEPFLVLLPKNSVCDGLVLQVSNFEGRMYADCADGMIDYSDAITSAVAWMPCPSLTLIEDGK